MFLVYVYVYVVTPSFRHLRTSTLDNRIYGDYGKIGTHCKKKEFPNHYNINEGFLRPPGSTVVKNIANIIYRIVVFIYF